MPPKASSVCVYIYNLYTYIASVCVCVYLCVYGIFISPGYQHFKKNRLLVWWGKWCFRQLALASSGGSVGLAVGGAQRYKTGCQVSFHLSCQQWESHRELLWWLGWLGRVAMSSGLEDGQMSWHLRMPRVCQGRGAGKGKRPLGPSPRSAPPLLCFLPTALCLSLKSIPIWVWE